MTEPYYVDEWVTLYHGDCLEITEWLSADVLVTDPPYGVINHHNHRISSLLAGDKTTVARDAALSLWGDRPALVFGKWTAKRPTSTRARLIWDKTPCGGKGDLSLPWLTAEEEIYVLGSGFVGKREPNVVRCPAFNSQDATRPNHPTPKPVALMEALIAKCPSGVVADPFTGSGSTLIAAKALGRRAVGVEIEERYCEIAAHRLAQDVLDFEQLPA